MEMKKYQAGLSELFKTWSGEYPDHISPLPVSGSERHYSRLKRHAKAVIGTYNEDILENEAFFHLTKVFIDARLNVPEIYAIDRAGTSYLQEDLGNMTLFDLVNNRIDETSVTPEIKIYYYSALNALIRFQTEASKSIDYTVCYPRESFDAQAMLWDLNYFKYNFLKLLGVSFSEQNLEDDFSELIEVLLAADNQYFMYRDFQSRNIMIHKDDTWFIDYQGGRKGPLQYDLASLVYQVRARLPESFKKELLNYYIEHLPPKVWGSQSKENFIKRYYDFALLRLLQVSGAYGFRGIFQRKAHFLNSLPGVIYTIRQVLNMDDSLRIPEIRRCLEVADEMLTKPGHIDPKSRASHLKVLITSFSYKKGMPEDPSENGGGYVFDCRGLPNPGREEYYRALTGKDPEVIEYLGGYREVEDFLLKAYTMVDSSVENYISRDFSHLMVSFGCTGGQHRSVYCTEELKKHLDEKYGIHVIVKHREL